MRVQLHSTQDVQTIVLFILLLEIIWLNMKNNVKSFNNIYQI